MIPYSYTREKGSRLSGVVFLEEKGLPIKSSGTMEGGTLHPQQANQAPYLRADKNKNEQRYNQPSPEDIEK